MKQASTNLSVITVRVSVLARLCLGASLSWRVSVLALLCLGASLSWRFFVLALLCFGAYLFWREPFYTMVNIPSNQNKKAGTATCSFRQAADKFTRMPKQAHVLRAWILSCCDMVLSFSLAPAHITYANWGGGEGSSVRDGLALDIADGDITHGVKN